jgi:predicted metal-dependent enzyme (double-stranded beta helix superfamily)
MDPIHPALAALARSARSQDFEETENALVVALRRREWLRPEHRVGDPTGYMRHLLYVDPGDAFVMTAITWLPGQVSPKHGHHVWCLYGVAEGELTEEHFPENARVVLRAGDMARPDPNCQVVHQVTNGGNQTVVSLHLYGIGAARLTTGINRIVS